MANKFFVGGGTNTNWNSSPTTNWANTSGGAGNQTAPVTGDSVFFDGNSGTGACIWNVGVSMATLDCTGSKNTITHGLITITISSGNLVLPTGVGGTYTASGTSSLFTFTGTSGTQQITTNGFLPGSLTFSGAGGTVQLQDNLTLFANLTAITTLTAGTFDAQSFSVTTAKFSSTNTNTRALKGSGLWTLGGSNATGTLWTTATTTGLDVSLFTSNITINGTTVSSRTFASGGISLAGILTLGANTSGGQFIFFSGSNTFGNFTLSGPNYIQLQASGTLTLSNAPTISGGSGSEIGFISSTIGTATSISVASGTAAFSWCAFRDITCSGGATFTASNSSDLGNNSGITITAPSGGGAAAVIGG